MQEKQCAQLYHASISGKYMLLSNSQTGMQTIPWEMKLAHALHFHSQSSITSSFINCPGPPLVQRRWPLKAQKVPEVASLQVVASMQLWEALPAGL